MIDADVLIIGAGISGLSAALECAGKCNLAVISKAHPLKSNSITATDGINAALNPNDNWEEHFKDTINKSELLGDQDAIELLTKEAPETIIELERIGVLFSRTRSGEISQKALDQQNFPRSCYVKDTTGHRILHSLYENCIKNNIKIYQNWFALKLIIENGTCKGVVAYNIAEGNLEVLRAKAVMLATGGYCRIYKNYSGSYLSTGDGLALVLKEGLPLQDMEFVQFHPTGIYKHGAIITEHVRYEGAYLLNSKNERFMKNYVPHKMETAAREKLLRAVETEIMRGFGAGKNKDYLLLDMTHFGEKRIVEKFPRTRETALKLLGIDPLTEKIPVQPVAHYSIGGIPTNLKCQVIMADGNPVFGLYAAGECACLSVHGANRLVGNSLLEKVVFGKRCGRTMLNDIQKIQLEPTQNQHLAGVQHLLDLLRKTSGNESPHRIRKELQEVMTKQVGIFRNARGLAEARGKVGELLRRFERIKINDKSNKLNTELVDAFETKNLLEIAMPIIECAHARTESRGAHNRTDYKKRDDTNWLKHSVIIRKENKFHIVHTAPVVKKQNKDESKNKDIQVQS